MKNSEYFSELGATASCALRAAKNASHKIGENAGELVLGDNWLCSVKAAVAQSKARFECVFQVKQNHALFPKKVIEDLLYYAPGGSKIVLTGCHPSGVELMAIGYK